MQLPYNKRMNFATCIAFGVNYHPHTMCGPAIEIEKHKLKVGECFQVWFWVSPDTTDFVLYRDLGLYVTKTQVSWCSPFLPPMPEIDSSRFKTVGKSVNHDGSLLAACKKVYKEKGPIEPLIDLLSDYLPSVIPAYQKVLKMATNLKKRKEKGKTQSVN